MGVEHNFMAHKVSALLLRQLRSGAADAWATHELSSKSTIWQGIIDWPKPDIAFEDTTSDASLAIEFKSPNQPKREYVTGLGQAILYLRDFKFSGLVIPERSDDGFEISKYLSAFFTRELADLPVVVFSYNQDPNHLTVLRALKPRITPAPKGPKVKGRKVFWGYWRDLSNFDLFEILLLIDRMDGRENFETIFESFWADFAVKGKALTWEGGTRKKKERNAKSKNAERLNAAMAMRHAGLLSSDHRLTEAGYRLLNIGKIYSPDSIAFLDFLTYCILSYGRHLDLIFWVDEQNRTIGLEDKGDRQDYLAALDNSLVKLGVIRRRENDSGKMHFIRDEPKLWNKLGLLVQTERKHYFHRQLGFIFDWRKIISVIDNQGHSVR